MSFRHGVLLCCATGLVGPVRLPLAGGPAPLAPTPVVGRVDQPSAHHTHHLRAEEVARPWTCVQATEQSRVSRFGDLAIRLESGPTGMAHPGNPFGAT